MPALRQAIADDIAVIEPLDGREQHDIDDILSWIASGAKIFRHQKPAIPPKHLVSYFVVVDGEYILLVDHKDAGLWLPTGGHVDPGEHPSATVTREAKEELGIDAVLRMARPMMATRVNTIGISAGHMDVCLWYVVDGDRQAPMTFSDEEFNTVRWFQYSELPQENIEPDMQRFVQKFYGASGA
jgi:8-oxo-dGTP diphosphatase